MDGFSYNKNMQFLKAPTAIVCALTLYVNMAFAILTPCCCVRSVDAHQSAVACDHCVQVATCCITIKSEVRQSSDGESCVSDVPVVRCACNKSIPTIFQSLDTHKRLTVPAVPHALQPFSHSACASDSDLLSFRDKLLKPVPRHGPPLLAFLCVWLN